jgi:hypothetical protein
MKKAVLQNLIFLTLVLCISSNFSFGQSSDLPKDFLEEKSITLIYITSIGQTSLGDYIVPTFENTAKALNEKFNQIGHYCYAYSIVDPTNPNPYNEFILQEAKKNNVKYINMCVISYMKNGNKVVDATYISTVATDNLNVAVSLILAQSQNGLFSKLDKSVLKGKLKRGSHGDAKLLILNPEKKANNDTQINNEKSNNPKDQGVTLSVIYDNAISLPDDFLTKKSIVVFKVDEGAVSLTNPNYSLPNFNTSIQSIKTDFLINGYCPSLYVDASLDLSNLNTEFILDKLKETSSDYLIFYQVELAKKNSKVIENHLMCVKSVEDIKNKKTNSVFFEGSSYDKMMNEFSKTITKRKLKKGVCTSSEKITTINSITTKPKDFISLPSNVKSSTLLYIKPNKPLTSVYPTFGSTLELSKREYEKSLYSNYDKMKKIAEKFLFKIIFIENQDELKQFQDKENTYIINPFVLYESYQVETNRLNPSNGSREERINEFTNFYLLDIKSKNRYYKEHGKKILTDEAFEKFLKMLSESK